MLFLVLSYSKHIVSFIYLLYFLDEYNKYYKDMMASKEKLSQIIDIYNIKAIASKKLGDYESALKSCDIAIKINPKDLEASNFKKFILKEKTDFEKAVEYHDNILRIKLSYQMNNFDYFLKLVSKDVETYNKFYQERLAVLPMVAHINSLFVMDEIKITTELPI